MEVSTASQLRRERRTFAEHIQGALTEIQKQQQQKACQTEASLHQFSMLAYNVNQLNVQVTAIQAQLASLTSRSGEAVVIPEKIKYIEVPKSVEVPKFIEVSKIAYSVT